MSQQALFLLAMAATAAYTLRLALRLAPPFTELPVKTFLACLLAAVVAFAGTLPYQVGDALRLFTAIAAPLYALGPVAAVALARLRSYRLAGLLIALLYWSVEGRGALRRMLFQVAVQQGDGGAARQLADEGDPLMVAQALAVNDEWERLVELELPQSGERGIVADGLAVQALLELGRVAEAERALQRLRQRWDGGPQSPVGYRSLKLSEARLAAERGDVAGVREHLSQPLPGVAAHQHIAVYARAVARSGRPHEAGKLYQQALTAAPPGARSGYERQLAEMGITASPGRAKPAQHATWMLAVGLAASYALQVWLDSTVSLGGAGRALQPSALAAAFLVGLPTLPDADAWWRYLSYALVHGNLIHIGFNVWVLVDIGRVYEARRGWESVIASFALGTAAGALLTWLIPQSGPSVLIGASGGVLGVAGALLAETLSSTSAADKALSRSLVRWMALIVIISVAIPNVSLWGHVGGVLGGMLWGFLRQGLPRARLVDSLAGYGALALLLLAASRAGGLAAQLASF